MVVSVFKGRVLVNIREFYEDRMTGEEKPGKTGIALSVDQWNSFKEQVCGIVFIILSPVYL